MDASCQTILIIDDDTNIRKMTSMRLEWAGYRVVASGNGDEGVQLAKREHPGAIVLDFLMPDMDGREVLRRLKADPQTRAIPVILLTVMRPEDGLYDSITPGQATHVTKPYKTGDLLSAVQAAVSMNGDGV